MDITSLVCQEDRPKAASGQVPHRQSSLSASTSLESLSSPITSCASLPPLVSPSIHPQTVSSQPVVSSAPTIACGPQAVPGLPAYSLPSPQPLGFQPHASQPFISASAPLEAIRKSVIASSPPLTTSSNPTSLVTETQQPCLASRVASTSNQRVECGLCGKSFSGISSHNRHVSRTHHKARPFSCGDCGLQFGQKGSLDRHTAAVHLKARPFECTYCHKGFGRKDNMKIHMTTVHLKKKPFKCDMCPKSFGGKRPLKIHRQTVHFKERPLQCPYCEKRFGQRSNLNVHMKVHKRAGNPLPMPSALPTSPIGSMDDFSPIRFEVSTNSRPSLESIHSSNVEVSSQVFAEQRPLGSPI